MTMDKWMDGPLPSLPFPFLSRVEQSDRFHHHRLAAIHVHVIKWLLDVRRSCRSISLTAGLVGYIPISDLSHSHLRIPGDRSPPLPAATPLHSTIHSVCVCVYVCVSPPQELTSGRTNTFSRGAANPPIPICPNVHLSIPFHFPHSPLGNVDTRV